MLIEINVTKKRPVAKKEYKIVCGNSGYKISFTFDSEWDAYELKTARFRFTQDGVNKHIDVVFEGNECYVPILTQTALVKIGVFAGNLRTTTPCSILCEKSIVCDGGIPEEPPNDIYNQLLEKCNEAVSTANDAKETANEAQAHIDKAITDAETASQEANEAAQNANAATSNVSDAIQAAIDAANVANQAAERADAANEAATETISETYDAIEKANTAADRANKAVEAIPNTFANALKGSAKGEIVAITDISPIVHNVAVRAASKNLIPYPYYETRAEYNGVTFTANEDGILTLNGTATGNIYYKIAVDIPLVEGNYKLTGCPENGGWGSYILYADNGGSSTVISDSGNGSVKLFSNGVYRFYLFVSAGYTCDNLIVKPMLRLASVESDAYTPYVPDVSAATLKVCGKNLINADEFVNAQFVKNENGSYTFTKTATQQRFSAYAKLNVSIPIGTIICLSVPSFQATASELVIQAHCKDNSYPTIGAIHPNVTSISHKVTKEITEIRLYLNQSETDGAYVTISGFQLEVGAVATPYEPYVEPASYPIAADGTVEGVTSIYPNMTITTDTTGIAIDAVYNRDINKAFAELQNALISLGGNI